MFHPSPLDVYQLRKTRIADPPITVQGTASNIKALYQADFSCPPNS
jgi:hypothetical protein